MTAFHGSGPDAGGELGPVRKLVSWLITLVVVIGTVAFSVFLLAAATGNLDTLRNLVGL